MRWLAWLAVASILPCAAAAQGTGQLRAVQHVAGLTLPVAFVQDPTDRSVQLVVEQGGRIRVIKGGVLAAGDFLNLTASVASGGERGLLGLALSPDYAASGRFFVNFTNTEGHTVVARFRRSANPLVADPGSRFDLRWGGAGGPAFIVQPFPNHNGGHLAFGPDGFLYIGLGDGGSGDDPGHRAQDPADLLGKMLRIDVSVPDDDPSGYRIPPDNPWSGGAPAGVRPEIWSFGLRNPWRYNFDDPARGGTGALIIGDVGQNQYEEVDYEPAQRGGRNYGWRNREGARDHLTSLPPAFLPLVDPIFEYDHDQGRSITGGYVYRGNALGAAYRGRYFFADFVRGRVWSIALTIAATGEATASDLREHTAALGGSQLGNISAFGTDADGELYVVTYSSGRVLRIASADPVPSTAQSGDFDGDGRAEVAVYRPSTGDWYVRTSRSGYAVAEFVTFQWGLPGDKAMSGDFDGDGKADLTVYRPSTGEWFIRYSSTGYAIANAYGLYQWGLPGDLPLAADFDGDGRTELTVYRPTTGQWFIRYSSAGYAIANVYGLYQWGLSGDVPLVGDFDGDRKSEVTVYRPATGEWFIRYSSTGYAVANTFGHFQWGLVGDGPVIGDFDGDGRMDLTVYRPSTGEWFIRSSSLGYSVAGYALYQWGLPGDVPIALDFDADGRTELTVYRPSTGEWFIRYSSAGYAIANAYGLYQWGLAGDEPLPRR